MPKLDERYSDPIHLGADGKWYYYIEDWCHENGPFNSRDEAEYSIALYCLFELGI